jgi:hypothetical protein
MSRKYDHGQPFVSNTETWSETAPSNGIGKGPWRWRCMSCERTSSVKYSTFVNARNAAVTHQRSHK